MIAHPILSILIPSVPSRMTPFLCPLLAKIERQIEERGHPVEVIALTDNKSVAVGQKRQMLLDIARGSYVTFVDDDDDVADDFVGEICAAIASSPGVSCVTFDELSYHEDNPPVRIRFGVGLPNTDISDKNPTRAVWHTQIVRRDIATQARFPSINYGEDWAWASQLQHLFDSEVHIDKPLRKYFYRSSVSQTQGPNVNGAKK